MEEHKLEKAWEMIDREEDLQGLIGDADIRPEDIERMQTIDHMLKRTPLVEPPSELDDNIMKMVLKEEVADAIKEPSFIASKDNMLSYVTIGFMGILSIGVILGLVFRGEIEESGSLFPLEGLSGNPMYLYAIGLVLLMIVFSFISRNKTTTV